MPLPSDHPCDSCGGTSFTPHMRGIKDYEYGTPGQWDVTRCDCCGLVRLDPFPTLEEALATYPDSYVQYSPRSNGIVGPLYRRFVENQGRIMAAMVPPDARVLDVGAACGEFMHILGRQNPGWKVTGLEPNAKAVETGRKLFGADLVQGTLEDNPFEEGSFDLVILTHVIEHVPSPTDTLARINRLLAPGGLLYGETENLDAPDAKVMGKYWGLFHIPRHLYFFTPGTLSALVRKAAFDDVQVQNTYNPGSWALGWQFYIEHELRGRGSYGRTGYYPLLLLAAMPLAAAQLALGMPSPAIRFICRKGAA
ncbi:MAG: class I SAM-dependent methyltransferase [Acidobacteriota bacterium]